MVEKVSGDSIAFLSQFVVCFLYASYLAFIKYLKKEISISKFIFHIIWAVIYLIIHAGRGAILTYVITMFFIYIFTSGKKIKTKNLLLLFIVVLLGVSYLRPLLVSLSSLTDGFSAFLKAFSNRISSNNSVGFSLSGLLSKLCFYVEHKYISTEVAIASINNNIISINYFRDIWVALVALIPASFLPFAKPNSIAYYNTALIMGNNSITGVIPPGGVAFGYYALGFVGVIIFSSAIGTAGKKLVDYFDSYKSDYMYGIKIINMLIWIDFFINGELKECVIRYFVFLVFLIVIKIKSKKVEECNE